MIQCLFPPAKHQPLQLTVQKTSRQNPDAKEQVHFTNSLTQFYYNELWLSGTNFSSTNESN